jgi:hypothetical protein
MSIGHTYPSHHRDRDAAISAVVYVSTPSAHSYSPGVHMELGAGRVFLTRRWHLWSLGLAFLEVNVFKRQLQPPRPDRVRSIQGSFGWIDHRFFRQGFDQGLTRTEKLLYLVLVAVSNRDGVSFYSDERLGELLDIRHRHELTGARDELVARDLIAFKEGVYQVLDLSSRPQGH